MNDATSLENYRDLYYQSHMNELIRVINEEEQIENLARNPEKTLLKASAYFELNRYEDSIECLKEYLKRCRSKYHESYLYMYGRLNYMNNDFERAEEVFSDLLENTDDPEYQYKSLQSLAAILYSKTLRKKMSLDDFEEQMEPILFDIDICKPLNRPDYDISAELLYADYHTLLQKMDFSELIGLYKKVIKKSSSQNWNYFVCRGLYGQAKACETYGKLDQMAWILDLLSSFVNEDELVSFSTLVNRIFRGYDEKASLAVKFDCKNQRIWFEKDWLPLHDRPLLYKFLKTIHGNEDFVPKGDVARNLWPAQEYIPRVHDPRIFDVAKRVRGILEDESSSLQLLSGRAGYKLITA